MRRSHNTARFACLVLALLLTITTAFACAHDCPLPGGVLTVAGQTPLVSTKATVTNNITVLSSSISLGSTLQVTGQVRAGQKPLADAPVALHVGDAKIAYAQTDEKGAYVFSVPVGLYYFPSALSNAATVYTVVGPSDSSFISTPSVAIRVPVDLLPLYPIIVAITGAVLLCLYLYARRLPHQEYARVSIASYKREADEQVMYSKLISEAPPGRHSFSETVPRRDAPEREKRRSPDVKRFIYVLLALAFITVVISVVLHIYSLEIFLVAMIIEFLALVEATTPASLSDSWRRNIFVSIVICVIVFAIILYRNVVTILR